ncbi:serine/threonine-protein kinase haspin homolog [Asparagus officinalis]|uniref:serine/threonine-protein kinase haspin homolog n=1 Tax=Asparagus officinalis TaxID=4686 RepID=UPI00098E6A8D|nr:serine/threonine-protein kinase haspin homolog [Asparagus officinalis]
MASQRGGARDLWAEISSQEAAEEDRGAAPKPQIAVVYGRRRVESENPREVQKERSRSSRENRVSFAPTKRISWKRSLSIRGRESIVVGPGYDVRPQLKQKGAQKKLKQKKAGQQPPDFRKEKDYFAEVDSFELIEESPSPNNFSTWAMGRKHDYVIHDLPAILERWRISKVAYSRPSQQLFKILETPIIPSADSCSCGSSSLIEKTPDRTSRLKLTSLKSYQRSSASMARDHSSAGDLNENCILSSFDSLRIKEEDDVCGEVDAWKEEDVGKEVDGAIRKESLDLRPKSFGSECLSAFTQLLMVCRQSAPVKLSEVFSTYCDPTTIMKLGEGTYGEAFRAGETVCKVVPIDGDLLVNGEVQKKADEVLEEVLLSLTLNSLREKKGAHAKNLCTGFIETKDFRVCQGDYDADLISAWEDWDAKHGSENDHPKEFPEDQCYIVFVLADGGKDLESFVLLNFDEARSLLAQVTAALAIAEAACEFEHRDLHWGNILLSRKETTTVDFTLEGKKMTVKTFGVTISIIDFTLSRINTGEAILFLDLSADPSLFEGPKRDKQSETYRKMKEVTEDCWEDSFPRTNVLWLIYLVDILLTKKSFKRTTNDERELRSLKKRLNLYDSAKDSLSDSFFCSLLDHHDTV